MSADNYIYVRKREDGQYGVSHRFASMYYRDEITSPPREDAWVVGNLHGWALKGNEHTGPYFATSEEAIESSSIREDWIKDPPNDIEVHATATEAIKAAYRMLHSELVVEYGGVQLSVEVSREWAFYV